VKECRICPTKVHWFLVWLETLNVSFRMRKSEESVQLTRKFIGCTISRFYGLRLVAIEDQSLCHCATKKVFQLVRPTWTFIHPAFDQVEV
jgi:hypothetical protein